MAKARGHPSGAPKTLWPWTATDGLLEVFGIAPFISRPIGPAYRLPGASAVVLVGHAFWQTRLQGTADLVGRIIRVDGPLATMAGVPRPTSMHTR